MYLNRCTHCYSHCFCNCDCHCHNLFMNRTEDLGYRAGNNYYPQYDSGKYPGTSSNGYEGDTMTSYSDNLKYLQPLNNSPYNLDDNINRNLLRKGVLNRNEQYCNTFQPQSGKLQFDQLNLQRADIDQLIKGNSSNKHLFAEAEQEGLNPLQQGNLYSQSFPTGSQGLMRNDYVDSLKTPLVIENNEPSEKSHPYRDTLDDSLNFIKYIASKENVNYIDDDFYIQNKEQFIQLLNSLVVSLYNNPPQNKNEQYYEEPNKTQIQRELNPIQNEELLFNRQAEHPQVIRNMYQVNQSQNEDGIIKEPLNKAIITHQEKNDSDMLNNQGAKLAHPNYVTVEEPKANTMESYQQPQEKYKEKQHEIAKPGKTQPSNVNRASKDNHPKIPHKKIETIYSHSFKERHAEQSKPKKKVLKKPYQLSNNDNNIYSSDMQRPPNKPDIFLYQKIMNNHNRSSSQMNNNLNTSYHNSSFHQKKKNKNGTQLQKCNHAISNDKDISYSPSRGCIACNVNCNVSLNGYSQMTYSPYGKHKKRKAITPIRNYIH